MTVEDRSTLQTAADTVRNETGTGANTAARVGGLLKNLCDSVQLSLTGAVTASAGNGATSFGSGDFDTLPIETTAYLALGSTVPATGLIRVPHVSTIIASKDNGGVDRALLTWGASTPDTLNLGYPAVGELRINSSGQFDFRVAATLECSIGTQLIDFRPSGAASFAIRNGGTTVIGLNASGSTVRNIALFAAPSIAWNSADRVVAIADRIADPTAGLAGHLYLYSASGALVGVNSSGDFAINASTLGALKLQRGGTTRIEINGTGIGVFGATPVSQRTLTDNTTGTPASQLVDVGAAYNQATINSNFASIRQVLSQYGWVA